MMMIDSCFSYFTASNWKLNFAMSLQKYLVRQNELGFKQFRQQYGDLTYAKVDSDEPQPEVKVTSSVQLPVTPVCFTLPFLQK